MPCIWSCSPQNISLDNDSNISVLLRKSCSGGKLVWEFPYLSPPKNISHSNLWNLWISYLNGNTNFTAVIKLRILRQTDYLDYPNGPNAITSTLESERGRQKSETERDLKMLEDGLEDGNEWRTHKLRNSI